LISLEAGDPVADGLGTVGGAALGDLGVEGREFAIVETDSDLGCHGSNVSHRVNHLVCETECRVVAGNSVNSR